MPTIGQLIRKGRKHQRRKSKSPALKGCPQKSAHVLNIRSVKPKKPNSALRKAARVRLSTGQEINVFMPGEGAQCQEHSVLLIRGGRTKDLVGFKYRAVRNHGDFMGGDSCKGPTKCGEKKRNQKRSKYGVPKRR